ncbi:bifunctional sugar phosphate isomerase/epimerase/4-hydroxyphenylpyruvate dioxygenase family protein [uncultured Maritimibacter sp.]|jgi:4-hydroxyphenylpyruvate dioxygenase|uniref:bifunctional sugar phosphate isomerase/epimerase/4-hydroxyphenylpyruvate dioxygenase family protein n=1 Tax=uncultured Maritimibacter sp. TaxID=991866 RepID=UPI000A4573BC|nr:sugar phosphate isomerase/epimerase and 4-hydroxyphenylpyruvate domain-containing protein [uncultured Maritimibacter sp.]
MKTSIATVSLSGSLTEKLAAIQAAGYDGIEIFEQDFIAFDGAPRDVGRMVRDHGLEITLFQPFRDFEGLPEPYRTKAFDRAMRKFDLMAELGTDLVLFCSSCHPRALGGIDRAADDFAALGERAAKRGMRVGYEALAWGKHVDDHRDAWEIVRRANHPNIGLILDSFHTLGRGIDPETIRRIPGDKIFFVQLADAPKIDMDLLYWSRHFRNMPGEGDLPVTDFMRAVMATGYSGPISLEIFNDQFRGGSTTGVARDGYRSLIALMDDVRRAEPSLALDLDPIPARVPTQGVAFVEFATRGDEARALERQLATLGFARAGSHVNKAVTLWQQGDIRIVVNEETEGHAGASYNARGTTVCDIGLSVTDAAATVARARALGTEAFSQATGPGELDIPAIRGNSGSVLHFIDPASGLDRVWEVEFGATARPTGAGLTRIDHLAQTMSYEDMLGWTLFYTSLFEMRKSPMVDVFDPDGLVRSQVVEAPDGALRVTLNGADSHRTLAGRFLSDSFGASVQHIALATDDIFATCETLAGQGFEPLVMPQNYYDDLAARFDIAPELLARMQALNILYDADERGTYFQCYSRAFAGGLFFEIVERAPAYVGFGAPNAPFRIAAQKRASRAKGIPAR